jgi:hypothetical protein
MEGNNEDNLPITENIVETDEKEHDEELVSQLADTLERPILNSKNTTKRPRSQAQVKAFAKARLALDEKRKLDRERKKAQKKPVGRPKKETLKEIPPVESVPEDTLPSLKGINNSNKKYKNKVTNMIIEDNSSSSDDEIIYVKNKKKKKSKKKKREPTVIYISASSSDSESSDEEEHYHQQQPQSRSSNKTTVQQQPSYTDPFDSIQFV